MNFGLPFGPPRQACRAWVASLILSACVCQASYARSEEPDLFDMELGDLGKIKVTTASKGDDTLITAPAAITVFNAEQIRLAGARSVFEVLEWAPGFTGLHGFNSTRSMVVRGISADNGVLVLMDGTPVNDAFSGNYALFEQPVQDFERIEIVRGPGSALYGGNALIGVINLITRQVPAQSRFVTASAGAGNHQAREGSVRLGLSDLDLMPGLRILAGMSTRESDGENTYLFRDRIYTPQPAQYLPPLTNPSLTPTTRQEHLQASSAYVSADYEDLRIRYNYARVESTPFFSVRGLVTDPGDTLRVDALNSLRLDLPYSMNDRWRITPKIYASLSQSRFLGDSEPPQIWADDNQDGLNESFLSGIIESYLHDTSNRGAEIQLDGKLSDNHAMTFSVIYDVTHLSDAQKLTNASRIGRSPIPVYPVQDMTQEFIATQIERTLRAALLEYRWHVFSPLTITAGVRASAYSDFGNTTNPRFAAVYQFSEQWYGKLLYGEAFVPPSFVQLFDRTPATSQFRVRGNPDLHASEIRTEELVLGYQSFENWSSSITLFDNRTRNEIFYDSTPAIERWLNSGARQARGIEWEYDRSWRKDLHFGLNVSQQKTEGEDVGLAADIHPHTRANLFFNYGMAQGSSFQATMRYYSATQREEFDTRPGIAQKTYLDMNYQFPEWVARMDMSLTLTNALDRDGQDETARADGIVDDIPRAGRGLWLAVGYRWP